jgi:DoxX-like family
MNIALWILQVLLALHTLMGAGWKLTNSEQSVPSLSALPHGVWLGLSAVEFLCVLGLLLPALLSRLGFLAPIAAAVIAAEMFLFCAVHLASSVEKHAELGYWGTVLVLCIALACGRWFLSPLGLVKA